MAGNTLLKELQGGGNELHDEGQARGPSSLELAVDSDTLASFYLCFGKVNDSK